jgi:hypothetical protein
VTASDIAAERAEYVAEYHDHPLVARGRHPAEVAFADGMLWLYRLLRVLQLMDESGHAQWDDLSRDDVSAWLWSLGEILGFEHGEEKSDRAIKGWIAKRLRDLGGMPYADYLQTPEWKDVRRFALVRANGRCQACNASVRLQVHHRTYARRGHELLDDVTVLCGGCHKAFHENRRLA